MTRSYRSSAPGRALVKLCVLIFASLVCSESAFARPSYLPRKSEFALVGAGDIADCNSSGDEKTAEIVQRVLAASKNALAFTAGDNAYYDGSAEQFRRCYAPSWGQFRERTLPSPGNHEYLTPGASAYFQYFGARAGKPDEGWYSLDHGTWHVVALNSNCKDVDCAAQARWLAEDLKRSKAQCTFAFWHHPRFSSGPHGGSAFMAPLWMSLVDAGVDVVMQGHDHIFERFEPLDGSGKVSATGMRSFVVGTGGASHYSCARQENGSALRLEGIDGVIVVLLDEGGYRWRFVDTRGVVRDAGSGKCR